MPFIIPTGVDRGDGVTPLPNQPQGSGGLGATFGTPSGNALKVTGQDGGAQQPEEAPDSPEIERAEQATLMHKLYASYSQCMAYLQGLGRGTFLEDSQGNVTRVLSSRLTSRPGNQAELTYVAESISFDTPPDEFEVIPVELGIDILKHPRYAWAISPNAADDTKDITVGDITVNYTSVKSATIRMIQAYRDSPFYPSADQINGLIQNNIFSQLTTNQSGKTFIDVQVPNSTYEANPADGVVAAPVRWDGVIADIPDDNAPYWIVSAPVDLTDPTDSIAIAVAAATEIISRLWRGEDVPYLIAPQVTYTQYFFSPQMFNPGSYVESPVGIVPDYFMSPAGDGSNTIFDDMATINPQCYSEDGTKTGTVNISWLRKSDQIEYQRTWFRYPHTWIGSAIGTFDALIYSGGDRPQKATDYDTNVV